MHKTVSPWALALAFGLASTVASAQSARQASGADLAGPPMMAGCPFERAWADTEERTEGLMLGAANAALARCRLGFACVGAALQPAEAEAATQGILHLLAALPGFGCEAPAEAAATRAAGR
jgi:hypothetical protein